jgi:exopolysaccharide production protein ExoQ
MTSLSIGGGASRNQSDKTRLFCTGLVAIVVILSTNPNFFPHWWATPIASMLAVVGFQLLPKLPRESRARWLPLTMCGVASLSIFWATDLAGCLENLTWLLALTLMTFVGLRRLGHGAMVQGIGLGFNLILGTSVLFLLTYPGRGREDANYFAGALTSYYPHRNIFGFVLMLGALSCLAGPRWRFPWIKVVVVATYAVVLMQTKSATSILLLGGGVLLLVMFRLTSRAPIVARPLVRYFIVWTGLVVVALSLVNLSSLTGILGRDVTLTGRTKIWQAAWNVIELRPVIGWGWGSVWNAGDVAGYRIIYQIGFIVDHSHNAYFDLALQLGIPMAALFLVGLAWQLGRRIGGFAGDVSPWSLCVLATLFVTGLVETSFMRPTGWLLLVVALLAPVFGDRAPIRPAIAARPRLRVSQDAAPGRPHVV